MKVKAVYFFPFQQLILYQYNTGMEALSELHSVISVASRSESQEIK